MVDEKLALGLARHDGRSLEKIVTAASTKAAATMVDIVKPRFERGKRLLPSELNTLVAEMDNAAGAEMRPLLRFCASREATRARPRGAMHELLYVHAQPFANDVGGGVELWSFRLLATTRKVHIDVMPTGLCFHLHTVQRAIQRDGVEAKSGHAQTGDLDGPTLSVAKAIVAHGGALRAVLHHAIDRDDDFGIGCPFGDGILAGTVDPTDTPSVWSRVTYDNISGRRSKFHHPLLCRREPNAGGKPIVVDEPLGGHKPYRAVTLRTYLPPDKIRPDQKLFVNAWNHVADGRNHTLDALRRDLFWPTRELWEPTPEGGEPESAAAIKRVGLLLGNPALSGAFRRYKPRGATQSPLAAAPPDDGVNQPSTMLTT